ncbi:MAG: geranylgeranyl reductase family protein [Cyclobacteriaceae bacterium]
MNRLAYDVIICGAGPAGTACAMGLEDSGLRVALLDKAVFPRDKICGDALSPDVINQLGLLGGQGTDPFLENFIANSRKTGTYGITFLSPGGHRLDVPVRLKHKASAEVKAPGYIMARQHFDAFLLNRVAEAGKVQVKTGVEVRSASRTEDGGFALETSAGPLTTGMLVIADGAQSRLARQLAGVKVEHDHYCAGLRQYWDGVTFQKTQPFIELHFIKDVLPGYFWVFPMPKGRANVGLGMLSSAVKKDNINLKEKLHSLIHSHPELSERFRHARPVENPKGWGLPIGSKKRSLSGDGYLLCGDAASLIDPFTGEGIGNAIRSGRVAADTVRHSFKKKDAGVAVLKSYDKEIYRRMGKELNLSRKMQQMLRYPFLFDLVVKKASRNPALKSLITAMLTDMDVKKELVKPTFYIRLLLGSSAK